MYLKKELYNLLKSDERIFDFIQESTLDGLWFWDLENPENEWMSANFWTVLGYNPDEMPHKTSSWQGIINQDDLKAIQDNLTKHFENPDYPFDQLVRYTHKNGSTVWIRCRGMVIRSSSGKPIRMLGAHHDITERKRTEEALEKRLIALTQPLDRPEEIAFEDMFNIADIQHLQDEFALATNVASIITHPDGTPITAPSNFTRLCKELIRKTEIGCANCFKSDAVLGRPNFEGPNVQHCLSGGLWDAGAAIHVGNRHIANWMIGQVRDEEHSDEQIRAYAALIGIDEEDAAAAFLETPSMSREQFEKVANALFILAKQFSYSAYQNVQQARFITERKQAENALLAKVNELERFQKLTVGRELTMIELKKEVNSLLNKLGEATKYKIVG